MKKIIFATKNKGKLKEVRHIFEGSGFSIIGLDEFADMPEIVEDEETFTGNAVKKAVTVFEHFGEPVIADDSGLAVEQLDWGPGVYSARYAGEASDDYQNNRKLLAELSGKPEPHKAKFVCAAVFYNGREIIKCEGEVTGRIIGEERGKNGFGYDPLFMPDGYQVTMGELELEEKNRISHRSKAFRKLKELIENKSERQ